MEKQMKEIADQAGASKDQFDEAMKLAKTVLEKKDDSNVESAVAAVAAGTDWMVYFLWSTNFGKIVNGKPNQSIVDEALQNPQPHFGEDKGQIFLRQQ